ncbi:hypothetical protein SAMN02910353_02543 [Ruminococcus sp. YRD2003]|uniref:hypothetical protein n=1 Tax=Ruminococcus sp. YRD2003 TaxID=1452313 RepID=UPI0008D30C5B|nr:hypothetical protein SAMN02910353_02543 [Ruminococcus flavefaciens]
MKKPRILVTSAREALRYVMTHIDHPDQNDTYAAISIQDTWNGGFGFRLTENRYCKGVLTLYFDDIEEPDHGFKLFKKEQALDIIYFIKEHKNVDTLLIHCYAGVSRSKAVGVFAREYLGIQPTKDIVFNDYVYFMLKHVADELGESEVKYE